MKLHSNSIKGFVFVTGRGLVKFKATHVYKYTDGFTHTQYRGKIRLPKGVRLDSGKKWIAYYHYFKMSEIFKSREEAIASISKKTDNDNLRAVEVVWNPTHGRFYLPVKVSHCWVLIDDNLPIEEQNLPPIEQDVLVYDGFATYISNRLDEEGIVWDESVYKLDKVTHWMFLPDKP